MDMLELARVRAEECAENSASYCVVRALPVAVWRLQQFVERDQSAFDTGGPLCTLPGARDGTHGTVPQPCTVRRCTLTVCLPVVTGQFSQME